MNLFRSKEGSELTYLFDEMYRIDVSTLRDKLKQKFKVDLYAVDHDFSVKKGKLGEGERVILVRDPGRVSDKGVCLLKHNGGNVEILQNRHYSPPLCTLRYKSDTQNLCVIFCSLDKGGIPAGWLKELKQNANTYVCLFLYVVNRFRASSAIEKKQKYQREFLTNLGAKLRGRDEAGEALAELCKVTEFEYATVYLCDTIRHSVVPIIASENNFFSSLKAVEIDNLSRPDIFQTGSQQVHVCLLDHKNLNCNCNAIRDFGMQYGVYVKFGHSPDIDNPRGILAVYRKDEPKLENDEKLYLRLLTREIAAWVDENDEAAERSIIEDSIKSCEAQCPESDQNGVDDNAVEMSIESIAGHLSDGIKKIDVSRSKHEAIDVGILVGGKVLGNVPTEINTGVFDSPSLLPLEESDRASMVWLNDGDQSFMLVVTSSMSQLLLLRVRVYEILFLLLKLFYRLVQVEHNRMTWTLRTIHEIRQPMQGLVAIADELQRMTRIQSYTRREISFWAEDMESGVFHIEMLLSCFDYMSGTQRFSPRNEEMLIEAQVLRPIRRMLQGLAEAKGITISETIGYHNVPQLNTDPQLVRMIFYNLLLNAIKYSFENTKIEVTCGKSKFDFWVEVENTGHEILENEKKSIFQPGVRGEAARKVETGLGLGLYMSTLIASAIDSRLILVERGDPPNPIAFRLLLPRQMET